MSKNNKQLVDTILKENGLDFKILKKALVSNDGDTTPYFGLFNSVSGACINTCKDGYHVSQNRDVVELVVEGMKDFGDTLKVYKAGSIHDGRKVYVQLEIAGTSKVGKDTIKRYVTIIDSNDGSTGLSVGIGDLTMSCQNQFFRFYKKGEAKFRHTATLAEKILTIPDLIRTALSTSLAFAKTYKQFASTPITKKIADELVKEILGHDRRMSSAEFEALMPKAKSHMNNLYENIEHELKDKGMNLWGLHSGVTRWTTHQKSAPKRDNGKIESLMIGSSYKDNQTSFQYCVNKAGILVSKEDLILTEA